MRKWHINILEVNWQPSFDGYCSLEIVKANQILSDQPNANFM
ncbi:hypothetical protein VCHENC01_3540 [Vibrio harveyi]|nr:hypothetical protein VCHENC01_3540 [Vibrio harveyi]